MTILVNINITWIICVMIDCRCWYSPSKEFCVKKQVSQNKIMLETSGEFLILSYILMIENILSLRNIMLTETFWHKHLHTLVVGQLNELVYNILHIILNNIHPPTISSLQANLYWVVSIALYRTIATVLCIGIQSVNKKWAQLLSSQEKRRNHHIH